MPSRVAAALASGSARNTGMTYHQRQVVTFSASLFHIVTTLSVDFLRLI